MIKVTIKPTVNLKKFNLDLRMLESPLTNVTEKAIQAQGCQYCHGQNLDVYINEMERKEIRGLYYCHDCNKEGSFTIQHDLIDQVEGSVQDFQNEIRKMFR